MTTRRSDTLAYPLIFNGSGAVIGNSTHISGGVYCLISERGGTGTPTIGLEMKSLAGTWIPFATTSGLVASNQTYFTFSPLFLPQGDYRAVITGAGSPVSVYVYLVGVG